MKNVKNKVFLVRVLQDVIAPIFMVIFVISKSKYVKNEKKFVEPTNLVIAGCHSYMLLSEQYM